MPSITNWLDFALGAGAGAVFMVVSSKAYSWVQTKIVNWVEAKAAALIAEAKTKV